MLGLGGVLFYYYWNELFICSVDVMSVESNRFPL